MAKAVRWERQEFIWAELVSTQMALAAWTGDKKDRLAAQGYARGLAFALAVGRDADQPDVEAIKRELMDRVERMER